tara:strand:- start:609 stop:911 length:303 start_codon:yes stop_codon:yes gene_type:complete
MELTVTLKIQVDDDKVFNALPQDMQEAVEYFAEDVKKGFTDLNDPDNVAFFKEMRSRYVSDYARRHFGDFWVVSNAVAHKELGIDVNDAKVISQDFRGDY